MVLLLDCPTYLGAWDRLKKPGGVASLSKQIQYIQVPYEGVGSSRLGLRSECAGYLPAEPFSLYLTPY